MLKRHFVLFILFIPVVENLIFLGNANKPIKVSVKAPSKHLKIEFHNETGNNYIVIKNSYVECRFPGYNVSIDDGMAHMEISNLTNSRSGYYKYMFSVPKVGGGANFEYDDIYVHIAKLSCGLTSGEDFIGGNDCGLKDQVDTWCNATFETNPKEQPVFYWKLKGQMKEYSTVKPDATNKLLLGATHSNVPVDDGDELECFVDGISCFATLHPRKLIFAKHTLTREMFSYKFGMMTHNNKEAVNCSANKSESIVCSYHWEHQVAHIKSAFPGEILQIEDLRYDGFYECFATCYLGRDLTKPCVLLANRVQYVNDKSSGEPITLSCVNPVLITMIAFNAIFILVFLFIYTQKLADAKNIKSKKSIKQIKE